MQKTPYHTLATVLLWLLYSEVAIAASAPEDVLAVARMVTNTKIASELRGDLNSRSDGKKLGEYAVYTISGKTYSVYASGTLRLEDQNPGTLTLYIRPVGTVDLTRVLVLTEVSIFFFKV